MTFNRSLNKGFENGNPEQRGPLNGNSLYWTQNPGARAPSAGYLNSGFENGTRGGSPRNGNSLYWTQNPGAHASDRNLSEIAPVNFQSRGLIANSRPLILSFRQPFVSFGQALSFQAISPQALSFQALSFGQPFVNLVPSFVNFVPAFPNFLPFANFVPSFVNSRPPVVNSRPPLVNSRPAGP